MIEKRSHSRAPIDCPLTFQIKGQSESLDGIGKDISVGGMFIETESPAKFGDDVVVTVLLPGSDDVMSLPARVRWMRSTGMGVQFGLLGAVETHVITEIGRKYGSGAD